ncbi:hypothetical protein [Lichenihabitans sp. Uapishka_5]|uniref:hypothetical protein n=1 Tax=Lichenihabitans sp. Uapishka_5 TaxID=3037302 RepID=UPI0029E7EC48|nr:hypothetical protein [Lichenihabitans sp. Uapishka_5]
MSLMIVLALGLPASAEPRHHGHSAHHRGRHIVGTHPRRGQAGFPITAAQDSIRINAVGEVISQPVPIIQKERNFNARARRNLAPASTVQPSTPAAAQP